jgi:hypothetical protein
MKTIYSVAFERSFISPFGSHGVEETLMDLLRDPAATGAVSAERVWLGFLDDAALRSGRRGDKLSRKFETQRRPTNCSKDWTGAGSGDSSFAEDFFKVIRRSKFLERCSFAFDIPQKNSE